MSETNSVPVPCPKCGQRMRPDNVKTVLRYGEQIVLVENIPAMVCDACAEQFYDDEMTEALLRLTEEGFPGSEKIGEVLVPVYTVKRRTPPKEEAAWPAGG